MQRGGESAADTPAGAGAAERGPEIGAGWQVRLSPPQPSERVPSTYCHCPPAWNLLPTVDFAPEYRFCFPVQISPGRPWCWVCSSSPLPLFGFPTALRSPPRFQEEPSARPCLPRSFWHSSRGFCGVKLGFESTNFDLEPEERGSEQHGFCCILPHTHLPVGLSLFLQEMQIVFFVQPPCQQDDPDLYRRLSS